MEKMLLPRVGFGSDVHAYAQKSQPSEQRKCMVACIEWPGESPLEGHSDADVAAHAICDALLSAANLGDLGVHFGVDRPEWAGASGKQLLQHTLSLLADAGWCVGNVTVQVIANRPRMRKRYDEARAALEQIIGASVSVSATTTDGLGFTGKGEGAAAFATCLIYPRELTD